jgi:hypothetical protein
MNAEFIKNTTVKTNPTIFTILSLGFVVHSVHSFADDAVPLSDSFMIPV